MVAEAGLSRHTARAPPSEQLGGKSLLPHCKLRLLKLLCGINEGHGCAAGSGSTVHDLLPSAPSALITLTVGQTAFLIALQSSDGVRKTLVVQRSEEAGFREHQILCLQYLQPFQG